MRADEGTYYDIKKLHRIFAVASLGFLAATFWMVLKDHFRLWKEFQRAYHEKIVPYYRGLWQLQGSVVHRDTAPPFGSIGAPHPGLPSSPGNREVGTWSTPSAGGDVDPAGDHFREIWKQPGWPPRPGWFDRIFTWPFLEPFSGKRRIHQITLTELPLDYHFRQVPRIDRCATCHQGMLRGSNPVLNPEAWKTRQWRRGVFPACDLPVSQSDAGEQADSSTPTAAGGGLGTNPQDFPPQSSGLGPRWWNSWQGDASSLRAESVTAAERVLGLRFVPWGLFEARAPTIGVVFPGSPAAQADLRPGDILIAVDRTVVDGPRAAAEHLLAAANRGKPFEVIYQRGLPHPFADHPRPDLYVAPQSPHPIERFGCTICHGGQGGNTSFSAARHWPSDPEKRSVWRHRYGWQEEDSWEIPMRPVGLIEAGCLRCHVEVVDLAAPKFFDPPAPKLLLGYYLVEKFGCFGCHEIRGWDENLRRVGPDLRWEPRWREAAHALAELLPPDDPSRSLAIALAREPFENALRRELLFRLQEDLASGKVEGSIATRIQGFISLLQREDSPPGQLPKVGPSLRSIAAKLDREFIEDFLVDPRRFRPDTRMPRVFFLYAHLSPSERLRAEALERVEIAAITYYLLTASQASAVWGEKGKLSFPSKTGIPPEATPPSNRGESEADFLPEGSADRGRELFALQGCVACHRHREFPEVTTTFGPDLSNLGRKLHGEKGRKWLRDWLEDPQGYSPGTTMPNPLLHQVKPHESGHRRPDPDTEESAACLRASVTDDLVAFLLADSHRQTPATVGFDEEVLDELAVQYLGRFVPKEHALGFRRHGIPPDEAESFPAEEQELIGPMDRLKKLRYVGRRSILRRGCFGCHDIPGFEAAQPIGPSLTGWGRKHESLLDFGNLHQTAKFPVDQVGVYQVGVFQSGGFSSEDGQEKSGDFPWEGRQEKSGRFFSADGHDGYEESQLFEGLPGDKAHPKALSTSTLSKRSTSSSADRDVMEESLHWGGTRPAPLATKTMSAESLPWRGIRVVGPSYFREALRQGRRDGFLWEKLRAPRGFDAGRASGKGYLDWLTMPQFPFDDLEREAVATFILGLVGEPVPANYDPYGRRHESPALEGAKLNDRLGCGQCHVLRLERWWVKYDADKIQEPVEAPEFAFLRPRIDLSRISYGTDSRGLREAILIGMVERDSSGDPVEDRDEEDWPLYFFSPWEPSPLQVQSRWRLWDAGVAQVPIADPMRLVARSERARFAGGHDAWLLRKPPISADSFLIIPLGANHSITGVFASGLEGDDPELLRLSARAKENAHLWAVEPALGGGVLWPLISRVMRGVVGSPMEALSRLPPPLIRVADAIEPAWLQRYLAEPRMVRPSVPMRMPRYALSEAQRQALVAFLAASSAEHRAAIPVVEPLRVDLPLEDRLPELGAEATDWPRSNQLSQKNSASFESGGASLRRQQMRRQAFALITDRKMFCAKCHLIGDYQPGEEPGTTLAPRLDQVAGRWKADWLRRWLAHPQRFLPYTGMPVNFPSEGPPLGQDLLPGSSEQQIEAVVDLLLHYAEFLQGEIGLPQLKMEPAKNP